MTSERLAHQFQLLVDPEGFGSFYRLDEPHAPRRLSSVPVLLRHLSAVPGTPGRHPDELPRFAGFGSRSPANDHVIALTDPRTAHEAEYFVLAALRWLTVRPHPYELPVAVAELQVLQGSLLAATGDALPEPVGSCVQLVDDEGTWCQAGPWRCAYPLFLPTMPPRAMDEPVTLPALDCASCGHHYTGHELISIARRKMDEAAAEIRAELESTSPPGRRELEA